MEKKDNADGQVGFPQGRWLAAAARPVTIPHNLAFGVFDVTRAEYAAFAHATGRGSGGGCYTWNGITWINDRSKSWRNPGFAQTERDPVVCVNREDAHAYAQWLNNQIGTAGRVPLRDGPYHLPTLEEAEYGARGGAKTAFPWGDTVGRSHANYGHDQCNPCGPAIGGADRWLHTSPVGAFAPNGFGLYDEAGNVWQLTESCWPQDTDSNCPRGRAARGGSWMSVPTYLSIGEYNVFNQENRNQATGFRLVRDLR